MAKILKINCRELYKIGMYFGAQSKKLENIVNSMKNINSDIKSAWDGIDYNTFYENYNNFLSSIKTIENSLLEKSDLLKNVALKHNIVDNDLIDNLKWSTGNE